MIYPVIISGGVGSRLWPVSRKGHPKPFIKMASGLSILQNTFLRALSLDPKTVINVTSAECLFKIEKEWAELPPALTKTHVPNYILEPFGRNTASAIAMAALWVAKQYGEDAILLVLPSDHLISDQKAFKAAVSEAAQLASQNKIVTFGIKPTSPETGYGYIEYSGYTVRRFVEKPSHAVAKDYVASGKYLWNSGMFCFKAGVMLQEMALHCPDILTNTKTSFDVSKVTGTHTLRIDPKSFDVVREDSIDYAVMEKSNKIAVVPCEMGWTDIGTWSAISDVSERDVDGNVLNAEDIVTLNVKNCYIEGNGRLIAAVGVDNLLIVDTPDALLIADRDHAQDVKHIYNKLAAADHQSHDVHTTVHRPWGSYTVLEQSKQFKIKRIEVHPGASLSLQSHQYRAEHWVVVAGEASIVNGEQALTLKINESTYIPAGHKHRLSNPSSSEKLIMIEVQTGSYLGEDDIQRFEDIYGRIINES